uniref:Uncharacterized protein n=1 Tax=Globodera pallida TaxID=36090 RepID=A0A183BN92_GLOPA
MHQIPLLSIILLSLLLLITTVVSVTVEVIEDGTPEGPDMAKALALSKRFFWRNMMANWSHYNDYEAFATPKEIGKISKKELAKLNVLKDLRQPKFLVEKGELQLSSAMEAIKSVYRDLFRWGQGSGLSFKMSFVNQKAWDLVHLVEMYQKYWELVQEFGLGMTEMCEGATKLEKMHDSTRLKFVEILKAFGRLFLGKSNSNDGPPEQRIEELSGTLFWRLRRMVRDMMLQMNHGNKLKPVLPDPCEEAKFKVKKTGKPPSSSH